MIQAVIEIKQMDSDCIEVLGCKYYRESYLIEMMNREYRKGLREGTTIHVAEIRPIN